MTSTREQLLGEREKTGGKPTLLGYLVAGSATELDNGRRCLEAFAAGAGYTLAGVYTDRPGEESAFYALFDRLRVIEATAVAVPALRHLVHLPALATDCHTASRYLHARLLVISSEIG